MAIFYKCDRCGTAYDLNSLKNRITVATFSGVTCYPHYSDLCSKCTEELRNFMDLHTEEREEE